MLMCGLWNSYLVTKLTHTLHRLHHAIPSPCQPVLSHPSPTRPAPNPPEPPRPPPCPLPPSPFYPQGRPPHQHATAVLPHRAQRRPLPRHR